MPQKKKVPVIMSDYCALRGSLLDFVTNLKQMHAAQRFVASLGKLEKIVLNHHTGAHNREHCTENEVLESGLMALTEIALQPDLIRAIATGTPFSGGVVTPQLFACLYTADPDFTLAVLTFIRRRWMPLRTSKAMRLYHFMANAANFHILYSPKHKNGRVIVNPLHDGEVAMAFEKSPNGQCVETNDVVKARTKVANDVERGLVVAARLGLKQHPINYLHGPKVEPFS